ncbi:acyl-CoA dehydrogenase domain protein (plasmid) [Haloterrigena turkmenica DSM 5511]|uniref:Acyl-CoA dehydrogenase domain protein n=1 Tax=Haloterrigena turkmenica (strain ATCC 51198 / DSM 5511 / JCM 9101 / NCIMB 13204 / VKM B-1734 / 4k) TaxID=543526 RepID=D2S1I4_HALTV|nr:acyl-CoA dehydrogenase family protein [Haloterrigena turkmenica]ADB63231.1 acyl-CoA dehydrogenase domain protein [Haloterrigena turkmenica DSM 5511]
MITHTGLEPRHEEFRDRVQAFCDDTVRPVVEEHEREGRFPLDLVDELGDAGLYGITIPEEYGGEGMDYRSFQVAVEELSRVWKIPAGVVSLSCSLVGTSLAEFGANWQREEWLRDIFTDNLVTAVSLTEPQAGSDAAALETSARRDGDELVIDGHKVWTSHGEVADFLIVVARTGDEGDHGDVSLIGISDPQSVDGLEFVRDIPCMEGDAVVESEVKYDGVRVPEENIIGEEGKGFKYIMRALDVGRIGAAAQGVGVAQGAMDASVDFADEREQFGQPIREFQGVSFKLADMAMDIQAARLMTIWAAKNLDDGNRVNKQASMAKTFATDVAMDVTTEAVQVHGSRGYSKDYPVERFMREAKGAQIYEGTNEVNRQIISDHLFE